MRRGSVSPFMRRQAVRIAKKPIIALPSTNHQAEKPKAESMRSAVQAPSAPQKFSGVRPVETEKDGSLSE